MDVKVALYAPVALWEVHHAQALDIAWREKKIGHEITVIHCDATWISCPANLDHLEKKCKECKFQVAKSIKDHFPTNCDHVWLSPKNVPMETLIKIEKIDSYEAMKCFQVDDHNFGLAVISHLVTQERNWNLSDLDVMKKGIPLLKNMIEHYRSFQSIFTSEFQRLFLFGGRRPTEAAARFAAIEKGIEIFHFEHGSKKGRWLESQHKIYTFRGFKSEIEDWKNNEWSDENIPKRREIGKKYFDNIRLGLNNDPYYKAHVRPNDQSPKVSKEGKKLLVVFTSSLWEFAGFDENLDCPIDFRNHYELYLRIGLDQEIQKLYKVVFRWHPNLKIASKSEIQDVENVIRQTPRSSHIGMGDRINSYELVKVADVVVTLGSTIGIESAYMGKPSILLGNALYSGLGSTYEPKSYLEFLQLIKNNIGALSPDGALLFGDWMARFGKEFIKVEVTKKGYFINGHRIESRTLAHKVGVKFNLLKHLIKRLLKVPSHLIQKSS